MKLTLPSYPTNEAPIHILVDDILAYIFLLNATLPGFFDRKHASKTTVASSQVCRRWRSVALECRRIWGYIIDYSRDPLKWIETMLDRSHPSSLDFGDRIYAVYLTNSRQDVLELVFNHFDRLRIFNLKVDVSSWELLCSRFLQLPAPNLEFACIIIDYHRRYRRYRTFTQQLTHPLFDHHAPSLQNLQLHRCMVDFTSPILTSLTELYVDDIAEASAVPTVLDWLNILGGMPSLRWVTLIRAISSATTNVISSYPIIHLPALNMLSVEATLHESVSLVEHLIAPPRCGLRLCCDSVHIGFDQQKLCAIIEKKMDSWAKNGPDRYLSAYYTTQHNDIVRVAVGNLPIEDVWDTEASSEHCIDLLDPVLTIVLRISNSQEAVPLFLSMFVLFERTFFNTTHLNLFIDYELYDGPEVFLPLVDSFRGFINLESVHLGYDSLSKFLFYLLQHSLSNSVLLPRLQSLSFRNATFRRHTTNSLLQVSDFLRWRGEQGFPVQKIVIVESWVSREYIQTYIQDTVVEFDDCYYHSEGDDEDDNN